MNLRLIPFLLCTHIERISFENRNPFQSRFFYMVFCDAVTMSLSQNTLFISSTVVFLLLFCCVFYLCFSTSLLLLLILSYFFSLYFFFNLSFHLQFSNVLLPDQSRFSSIYSLAMGLPSKNWLCNHNFNF